METMEKKLEDKIPNFNPHKVYVVSHDENLLTPPRQGDAGIDLRTSIKITLTENKHILIPTGVKVYMPEYAVGLVSLRSGVATNVGRAVCFPNAPGIIDSSYRGEIKMPTDIIINEETCNYFECKDNKGEAVLVIPQYFRLAQLVIFPLSLEKEFIIDLDLFVNFDKYLPSRRGSDGFGSTGKI